jgi:hypothetical protein
MEWKGVAASELLSIQLALDAINAYPDVVAAAVI